MSTALTKGQRGNLVKARAIYAAAPGVGLLFDDETGCHCAVGAVLAARGYDLAAAMSYVPVAEMDKFPEVAALAQAVGHDFGRSYRSKNWGAVVSANDSLPSDYEGRVIDPSFMLAAFDAAIGGAA